MPFTQISPLEAKKILQSGSAILADIRDITSFNQSHACEAYHLTQDNLSDFLLNTDKNTQILVICYHGNSSQMTAAYLAGEGFTNVYSIIGGYEAWIE